MSGPSVQTLKKLFARSGNRCAFPKCRQPNVMDASVIGRVCHIRAASAGGPRYDHGQSERDRHSVENLIILCPTHHAVIDDDTESYTVERLLKIKSEHERNAPNLDENDVETGARLLSQSAASTNQSGGITANSVRAGSINFNQQSVREIEFRKVDACTELWELLLKFKEAYGEIVYIDAIFSHDELSSYYSSGTLSKHLERLRTYSDPAQPGLTLKTIDPGVSDRLRLFVPPRLWSIYFSYRAITSRLGVLVSKSYKDRQYHAWSTDSVIRRHINAVSPELASVDLNSIGPHGLRSALEHLETQYGSAVRSYLTNER